MVKVKLNEMYGNDFLTTLIGKVFYAKNNKLGKECNVEDVSLDNPEISMLVKQGILVLAKEDKKMKENIITDNVVDKSIKEVKTPSNDEELEAVLEEENN